MKNIPRAMQAVDVAELLQEVRDFALLLVTSIQFPTAPIISCFPQSYKESAQEQGNDISLHNLDYLGEGSTQTLNWVGIRVAVGSSTQVRQDIGQPKPNTAATTSNINKEAHLSAIYLLIFTWSYTSSKHLKTLENVYEILQNSWEVNYQDLPLYRPIHWN